MRSSGNLRRSASGAGVVRHREVSPTYALWVPETAHIEFLPRIESELPSPASQAPRPNSPPSSSLPSGSEQQVLYVVNCTRTKIWDEDPLAPAYVPARNAYRRGTVGEWLAGAECQRAERWVFLSAKYGFIEPDHPIGKYDVTFSDPASGPMIDDCLRAQVQGQRRWHDRIPLRDFRTVYVWSNSTTYEEKTRVAFGPVGARIVRLASLAAL